ncbi:roadblock/LC7 domain-containing protein [Streptomyces huiliensis]|uniref:roadblock/LC7 domain-containing protein n=1 Tax=Streptomyces huiliensis TaxID=2876027 RepID=UPI001CBE07FF|nr:roadblock/LC7 domain-containing protein [Streptomyces huiliensis]MBZ4320319.1 roadblock/LC7 domain-containing protein [Streptomyces huiliensis]
MSTNGNLEWLLADILRVPAVRHALVVSRDGLRLAGSPDISTDDADRLSAVCSGLLSLGHEAAAQLAGDGSAPRQVMVEFDGGFLFLVAAGPGASLAVATAADVDAGLVAREMQHMVVRIGQHLSSPPRARTATP